MTSTAHSFEREEIMAYLDGELPAERALAIAEHLDECPECKAFAAELRAVSQTMMNWTIETSDKTHPEVREALSDVKTIGTKPSSTAGSGLRFLLTRRGMAWAGAFSLALLLIAAIAVPNLMRSRMAANEAGSSRTRSSVELSEIWPATPPAAPSKQKAGQAILAQLTPVETPLNGPLIIRTASLGLIAKDITKVRADLEMILKRHSGYIGQMSVSAPTDAEHTLTATLRIPAARLEAAISDLKALGRVETESQSGEEVTQQYVDLVARLANAQHTEQRLTEMLRDRTGKLQDVLKVELEIDRVRGEIEQMQAEKKALSKQIAFATVNATIKEEYKAQLQAAPPSTGNQFRNAAVDGYRSVVEGLISVLLFLLSAGPSLLLWTAILFFPARLLWKKVRKAQLRAETPGR